MGKLALDNIADYLASQLAQSKEHRDVLNGEAHLYTLTGESLYREMSKQLSKVKKYSKLKSSEFETALLNICHQEAPNILDSIKNYTGDKSVTIIKNVRGMPNSILIVPETGYRLDVFNFIKNSNRKRKIKALKDRFVTELFGDYTSTSSYKRFMSQSDEAYSSQVMSPSQSGAKKYLELNNAIFGTAVKESNSNNYKRYADTKENRRLGRVGQIIPQGGGIDIIHSEGDAVHKQRQALAIENLLNDSIGGIESILGGLGSDIAVKVSKETLGKKLNSLKSGFTNSLNIGFEIETIVEVSEGGAIFNRGEMAKAEKKELASLIPSIRKMLKKHDWAKQPGSDTPVSAFEKVIVNTAISSLTGKSKNSRVKNGKKLTIDESKNVGEAIIKAPKASRSKKAGPKASINQSTFREEKVASTQKAPSSRKENWSSLLPLINQKLTPRVIANMKYPSLINRTGTFAQSAKVVAVTTSNEGFPSFTFDYDRDPYNVFDKYLGRSPWNTPQRDPRALVDKSLREVLKEMAIGRFYTRRA